MTWDIDRWAALQRAAGRPETTIGLRAYHLGRAAAGVGLSARAVTVDDLAGWLAGQGWAPETLRSYRASLRAFFTWMVAAGERPDNPAAQLGAVRVPRAMPRPTPETVWREAAAAAPARVALMIQLAARCGLRRGELARLTRRDVVRDLVGWSLVVHGKGGHVRNVPLPDDLARGLVWMPHGPIFTGPTGDPLTPEHLGKLVSRALPAGWTCHTLRHRCATVAYHATRDLRAVQELLGHAKPETTAAYTAVPAYDIRACVAATA